MTTSGPQTWVGFVYVRNAGWSQMAAAFTERERDRRGLSLDTDLDVREWDLDDPSGADHETAREIRDAVERRVSALFDDIVAD